MAVYGVVAVGVTQESTEEFGGEVVIEREAGAVGNLVVVRLQAEGGDEGVDVLGGTFACGGLRIVFCCNLIEERLRHGVVAIFHHGQQQLVYGVCAGADALCCSGHWAFCHTAAPLYSFVTKGVSESFVEGVAVTVKERSKGHFVIVPAPSPAEPFIVLKGEIGAQFACDAVYAAGLERVGEGAEIFGVDEGVVASTNVEVSLERGVNNGGVGIECGAVVVVCTEGMEGGDGCDEFFVRRGSHTLLFVVGEYEGVGGEVVYVEAYLCALKYVVIEEFFEALGERCGVERFVQ